MCASYVANTIQVRSTLRFQPDLGLNTSRTSVVHYREKALKEGFSARVAALARVAAFSWIFPQPL